jgi:hypothetical protein
VLGIFRPRNIDSIDDGPDLVAKIRQEPQGIFRIIGDARYQAGNQKLARDHASVQFIHLARRSVDIDPMQLCIGSP